MQDVMPSSPSEDRASSLSDRLAALEQEMCCLRNKDADASKAWEAATNHMRIVVQSSNDRVSEAENRASKAEGRAAEAQSLAEHKRDQQLEMSLMNEARMQESVSQAIGRIEEQQTLQRAMLSKLLASVEKLTDHGEPNEEDEMNPLMSTPENKNGPSQSALRTCKLLYLLLGFSGSAFGRFAALFYLDLGFSPAQIGVLESVQPIAQALGNLFWGYIADRLWRKKGVALLAQVVSTSFMMMLPIPIIGCQGCFVPVLAVMSAMAFFSVGNSALDAFTLESLGPSRAHEYGQFRMWTAVAWGIGNVLMGQLADIDFNYNFIAYGVMNAIGVLTMAFALPSHTETERRMSKRPRITNAPSDGLQSATEPLSQTSNQPGFSRAVWHALRSRATCAFFAEAFVLGVLMSFVDQLLFVYMRNELGLPYSLCGWAVLANVSVEVPIFFKGAWLLRNVGHDCLIMCALAVYAARVYGYTLLTPETVGWLLALETAHGLTAAIVHTTAVDYLNHVFPGSVCTTAQMLLNTIMYQIARVCASLFGGWFLQHGTIMGLPRGRGLYSMASVIACVTLVIHFTVVLVLRFCFRRRGCLVRKLSDSEQDIGNDSFASEASTAVAARAIVPPVTPLLWTQHNLRDLNQSSEQRLSGSSSMPCLPVLERMPAPDSR